MRKLFLVFAAIALLCLGGTAQAMLLTFDDIDAYQKTDVLIANGYQGFNWNNFYVADKDYSPNSGYNNGTVSDRNTAYNGYGHAASMLTSGSTTFDLNSAYLTGAWNDGLNVKAEGYLGGVLKYTKTVTVSFYSPTLVSYEFGNIDTVLWSSWGGNPVPGTTGSGVQFAMDNLTVNGAVPEPGTILAALSILGPAGFLFRRRA